MKIRNRISFEKRRKVGTSRTAGIAAVLGTLLLSSTPLALAQYGVRRTAVVHGPNQTVVASKKTVVGPGGAASKTTVVGAGGAASRTTVVAGGGAASRTTVVATGGGLPHGYIATLPLGYRAVVVSGARYYTVGGVYYRPQIYGGRTVYDRVHI